MLPFEDPGLRTLVTQKPVSEKIADSLVEQEVTKTLATFLKEYNHFFLQKKTRIIY